MTRPLKESPVEFASSTIQHRTERCGGATQIPRHAFQCGTITSGNWVIVRNPSIVDSPTRNPVKEPGPIETTSPSSFGRARPVSENNRSMVGNNSLPCDPAASWSQRPSTLSPSRSAILCHDVAVSTARIFMRFALPLSQFARLERGVRD